MFLSSDISFLTHRTHKHGGSCLACVKREFPVSDPRNPVINILSDILGITIRMHNPAVYLRHVHRPRSSNGFEFPQLINAFKYIPPIQGEAKLITRDFNSSKMCWSTKTASRQLLNFVRETNIAEWTWNFSDPTGRSNMLNQASIHSLNNFVTSLPVNWPSNEQKTKSCLLYLVSRPRTFKTAVDFADTS